MPNKKNELHHRSNNTLPFQVKVNFFKVNKIPSKWTTFEVKTLLSKMTQILSKKNSLSLKKCFLFLLFGFSSFFLKPFLFLVKIFAIKSNKTVTKKLCFSIFNFVFSLNFREERTFYFTSNFPTVLGLLGKMVFEFSNCEKYSPKITSTSLFFFSLF